MAAPRVEIQSMPLKAQEPEDMFADSAPPAPVQRTPVMPSMAPIAAPAGPSMAKVALLSLVIIVLLGGAAFGVYTLMNSMSDDQTPKRTNNPNDHDTDANNPGSGSEYTGDNDNSGKSE
jgi:hypothetical protein